MIFWIVVIWLIIGIVFAWNLAYGFVEVTLSIFAWPLCIAWIFYEHYKNTNRTGEL